LLENGKTIKHATSENSKFGSCSSVDNCSSSTSKYLGTAANLGPAAFRIRASSSLLRRQIRLQHLIWLWRLCRLIWLLQLDGQIRLRRFHWLLRLNQQIRLHWGSQLCLQIRLMRLGSIGKCGTCGLLVGKFESVGKLSPFIAHSRSTLVYHLTH
jgi:hypothetical protein